DHRGDTAQYTAARPSDDGTFIGRAQHSRSDGLPCRVALAPPAAAADGEAWTARNRSCPLHASCALPDFYRDATCRLFERGSGGTRGRFLRGGFHSTAAAGDRPSVTAGHRHPPRRAISPLLVRCTSRRWRTVPRGRQTRRGRRTDAADTPGELAGFCAYQAEA